MNGAALEGDESLLRVFLFGRMAVLDDSVSPARTSHDWRN
jgi:hypothetical protein